MKKLLLWWLQRLLLFMLSILVLLILFIYAGPKVLMQEMLSLDIVEGDAEIEEILEERRIVSDTGEKYEYTLVLNYSTVDMIYHRTFAIMTDTPLANNSVLPVKYYKKFPQTVYVVVNGETYQPSDMETMDIFFTLALLIGIPVGIYTIYFFKKKKKPRVPKKQRSSYDKA